MAHSRNSVQGLSQDPEGRDFSPGTNQANSRGALASEARSNAPLIFLAPLIVLRRCRLACVVFLLLAPILLPAQDPTLRMDVKLVNLFVNVTDQTGAIVGGLKKEDFKVAEDGRPQEISIFERESELPLNLTLAIDTSGSTFKDRAIEQDASRRFVHALLRSQDQMSLIEFATDVRLLVAFTNKVSQIDHALGALRGGDATALYDAIYLGAQGLAKKDGRKVLKEIKEDDKLKAIPVVVLTVSKAEEDILRSYNLHANCYITKPVDLGQFIKVAKSIQDFWLTIVKLPKSA